MTLTNGVGDQYLRHSADADNHLFGVIASQRAHLIWLTSGKIILTARCENVVAWNLKTASILAIFASDGASPVAAMAMMDQFLAVGYVSGEIRVFSMADFASVSVGGLNEGEFGVRCHG